jgi:hypothetical protein
MPTDNNNSLLGTLLTWFIIAVLFLVAVKMVFWALGVVIGLSVTLLSLAIHLLPILLIGWLTIKLYRALFGSREEGYDTI